MKHSDMTVERTVTVRELAFCSGTSSAAIHELLEHDLLSPAVSEPEVRFAAEAVEHVRRIRRLTLELEVDYPAMNLVLDLLDRIERLERRLQIEDTRESTIERRRSHD